MHGAFMFRHAIPWFFGTCLLLRRILHVLRTWRASRRVSSLRSDHGALICFADAIPWLFGTCLLLRRILHVLRTWRASRRVSSLRSDHGALICFADAIPWLFCCAFVMHQMLTCSLEMKIRKECVSCHQINCR